MKQKQDIQAGRIERLRTLAVIFFKISMLALGGGLTMIPPIEAEFVEKRHWLSKEDMVDCIAVVQSLPGIIGANLTVMIGYRTAGIPGAFAATLGMVLPPFLAILVIAMCFLSLDQYDWLSHAFAGVRAAICALILLTAVKMGKSMLKAPFPVVVAAVAFGIFTFFPQVNAIWVILGGAAAGILKHAAAKAFEGGKK